MPHGGGTSSVARKLPPIDYEYLKKRKLFINQSIYFTTTYQFAYKYNFDLILRVNDIHVLYLSVIQFYGVSIFKSRFRKKTLMPLLLFYNRLQ